VVSADSLCDTSARRDSAFALLSMHHGFATKTFPDVPGIQPLDQLGAVGGIHTADVERYAIYAEFVRRCRMANHQRMN
jgi:hypothetical protein